MIILTELTKDLIVRRDLIDQSQPSANVTEVFRGNETVPELA